jgi:GntR family transcriptional regulator
MRVAQPVNNEIVRQWNEKIDRSTPMPLYFQLKQLIKNDIESGVLKHGETVPTEAALSVAMGISRPTIRQCMTDLVSAGYLTRAKGKGTFVSPPKIEANYIQKHESFHTIIRNCGYTPRTIVLRYERIPGIPAVNEKLQIDPSEDLNYLVRLCLADEEPMLISESFTQASRFEGILNYRFDDLSLYGTLEKHYNTRIDVVRREIGAANASQKDAEMLNIPKNKAICLVYNLAFDEQGRPTEYSASRYRGDKIKFTNFMKC